MPDPTPLDAAQVVAAVRALLLKETERVDDPHFIPEDCGGWHAYNPLAQIADDTAGTPYYDPEAWRWFKLVDLGYVDEIVLLTFRWTDPTTPELRYSYLAHADGLPSADSAATVVRNQLRRLLEPGWRDRVEKQWLSRTKVLIHRPRGSGALSTENVGRLDQLRVQTRAAAWATPRTTGSN